MTPSLQPQAFYPIVRQISNHLDTDVLYVRAVVRNADGDTIATVDLEDKGGQRFQRRYRVPVDTSGQGAYISIITSVYTDSGYTTKSPNYGDEENTYLIFDRVLGSRGGGGGSNGPTLTLKQVREVISEELAKIKPESVEVEEPESVEPMRWEEILTAIDSVGTKLEQVVSKIPTETVSLEPVINSLSEVKQMIVDKEVTPVTDLTPVYEELDTMASDIDKELVAHRVFLQEVKTDLTTTITDTVKEAIETTEFTGNIKIKPQKSEKEEKIPEIPPVDLRKLV